MDIKAVLAEYDSMYGKASADERDAFLAGKIEEAKSEGDYFSLLTLLNEQIGFFRDTGQRERGIACCTEALAAASGINYGGDGCGQGCPSYLRSQGFNEQNDMAYAKTLLNIATCYREFGMLREAETAYDDCEAVYRAYLAPDDPRYAAFYNNKSTFYIASGEYDKAADMLKKALDIVDNGSNYVRQAVSRVNLAVLLMDMHADEGQDEELKEAEKYLKRALTIFEAEAVYDLHYAAALSAVGDLYVRSGSFNDAAAQYEKALSVIELCTGDSAIYRKVKEKFDHARTKIS